MELHVDRSVGFGLPLDPGFNFCCGRWGLPHRRSLSPSDPDRVPAGDRDRDGDGDGW